jgi:hypothetical protein
MPQTQQVHEMRVMGTDGDTRISWDPGDVDSTATARRSFDDLVTGRGYRAFRMGAGGARGEPLTAFDPSAEQVIITAPLRGG